MALAPAIGFDIGGQSIKAALVSTSGEVLARATAATGEATDVAGLCERLVSLRAALTAEVSDPRAVGVGIGIAGVLDRAGALRGSPHLPLLVDCRIAEAVSASLNASVVVHNDADCAAVAEGWGGAADGIRDYLMIAIGTGLGAGLVLDERLRAGASGFGCEFGHMIIVHGGRRCGCGNLGCLEAYLSETAAQGLVGEASPGLAARVEERRQGGRQGFAQALFGLGDEGDTEAEAVAGGMVDVLGSAIASAVNVLDLTTVVLGGGLAPGVLARMGRLGRAVDAALFARSLSDVRILAASRGPLAGAIGASRLGMLAAR